MSAIEALQLVKKENQRESRRESSDKNTTIVRNDEEF